jgi:hypothetical protein
VVVVVVTVMTDTSDWERVALLAMAFSVWLAAAIVGAYLFSSAQWG